MPLTGREKATIFLSLLGAQTSGRVLRYLPEELADVIAAGINHLPTPSPEAVEQVLGEFKSYLALPQRAARPAAPKAAPEKPKPVAAKRSYSVLMYERPQMVAYLLSLMPEDEKEEALHGLPREKAMVEELLAELKRTPLSPKLEKKLKEQFKDKLFLQEN